MRSLTIQLGTVEHQNSAQANPKSWQITLFLVIGLPDTSETIALKGSNALT